MLFLYLRIPVHNTSFISNDVHVL